MSHETYTDFKDLVNADVRDRTSAEETDWLRTPDNLIRFVTELRRLETTVTTQIDMSRLDPAWANFPEGARRDQAKIAEQKAETKRLYYREKVRARIAEVEDLIGPDAVMVTKGHLIAVLEAALDANDAGRGKDVNRLLEAFLDVVEPPLEVEVA